MSGAKSNRSARSETTRRYIRRTDAERLPFFPWGVIPALLLFLLTVYALFFFAKGAIEKRAEESSRIALQAAGESWANVDASGQWVTLTGQAPSAERAAKAELLVREATSRTPFGHARPVTRVRTRFVEADKSNNNPVPETPAPSETDTGLGEPEADAATDTAQSPVVRLSTAITLEQENDCNRRFADLLLETQFNFASNSSEITVHDEMLLERLVFVARDCPGTLVIEGHTDSTGNETANRTLSHNRAMAVRMALIERGLEVDRLRTRGYGSARPIESNDTAEGRAKNRRIEIRLNNRLNEN